jgi:hypothetical protein
MRRGLFKDNQQCCHQQDKSGAVSPPMRKQAPGLHVPKPTADLVHDWSVYKLISLCFTDCCLLDTFFNHVYCRPD